MRPVIWKGYGYLDRRGRLRVHRAADLGRGRSAEGH